MTITVYGASGFLTFNAVSEAVAAAKALLTAGFTVRVNGLAVEAYRGKVVWKEGSFWGQPVATRTMGKAK